MQWNRFADRSFNHARGNDHCRLPPASECASCVVRSTLFHQSDHLQRARRPFYGRLKLPSSRRRPSRLGPSETAGRAIHRVRWTVRILPASFRFTPHILRGPLAWRPRYVYTSSFGLSVAMTARIETHIKKIRLCYTTEVSTLQRR